MDTQSCLLEKGGHGLRMCIDYRSLNSNTVSDAWPLPRIDDLLSRLRGATTFSKLDLRDAYYHIPIAQPLCSKQLPAKVEPNAATTPA